MKNNRKYRIIIEDRAHLLTLASWSLRPRHIILGIAALLLCAVIIGFIFTLVTPAKRLIPGYYQPSERAASEEAMLRLDSIADAYQRNNQYLFNLLAVIQNDRPLTDTIAEKPLLPSLTPDSLIPASNIEKNFNRRIREREKYNISIVAPMAAEKMLLFPVSEEAVVTPDSHDSPETRLIMPPNASVMAIADGTVIATFPQHDTEGYSIIIQHHNGFVSRYSGLGTLLTGSGDYIQGGQVIALAPKPHSATTPPISVRLWHNGSSLNTYKYISGNIDI